MSNFIKRSFAIYMVLMMTVWGLLGVLDVNNAQAASANSLIKKDGASAVYYLDANLVRHPFNHAREFFTWYADFSSVTTVSASEMSGYEIGSTVVVRPGTGLVQFVSIQNDGTMDVDDPKVYAVEPSGTIRHIDSAATAAAFYGSNWEQKIVPIMNVIKGYYTEGAVLTSSSNYPTGSLVKTSGSSQVYYIDGTTKRPVTDAGFTANRFNMDYVVTASSLSGYTDGSSVTAMESGLAQPMAGSGSVAVGTGLTVALAAGSPGASVAPISATNVPLMKFNLTASADGSVTVNQINVKRLGVGSSADFNYLYLYEGAVRLTNGKTINSTTNTAQFVNMAYAIPAGTTKTLTLSADISTGTSGNVSYFQIASTDITTSAAVNGSFPISSNTVTIGSVAAGSVRVEKDGTLSNPSVGQQDVKVAQFKLIAGTGENLSVNRITLYEAGTLNSSYLTDLKLYQNTTLLSTVATVDAKGYVVFDLSASPFTLEKNTNRIFHVTADISGSARNGDTIVTYVDQTTDIYAIGASYGFGASVDIGATSGTYDGNATGTQYSTVTVQGGEITVAMNGPVTGNLATGATEAVLMNFSITSGVNAEIRSLRVELHKTSTDLDTDASTDCASGTDYIANVKVVDVDNGDSTSAINCGSFSEINGSDNGLYYAYTDYFTLTAGQTRNFAIKADLNSSLTAGTYYAILGSSATSYYTFSSTAIKNTDNNQYIAAANIVPSTFSQGNNQTVAASGLYASMASNLIARTVVQGTSGVDLGQFALKALDGSDVTISGITMYGYLDGDGVGGTSTAMVVGSDTDVQEQGMSAVGTVYVNNLVTNLKIYDLTADPNMTTNLNSTIESMDTGGAVSFANMNWTIPAGETHVLGLVGDVTSSAFENGDTGNDDTLGMAKYVKFNIASATDVTATDESNNSVTMKDDDDSDYVLTDLNGSATSQASSYYINIAASGTLNVTAESNPAVANVVAGTSNVPVLNLKFQATSESFNVNKFRISETGSATSNRSASSVTVSYQNQAGTTVTATQNLISGVANFNITANPLYVPANNNRIVNVYFNIPAINQIYAAYTGDGIKATFDANDTTFEAKGAGSSRTSLTDPSNSSSGDINGNMMTVHGTLPTFTVDTTTNTTLAAGPAELYRFMVSAAEGSDLNLKKLSFKLSMTDTVTSGVPTLSLRQFQIYEGSSYAGATQLTVSDTATNGYNIYNGYSATSTVLTGASTYVYYSIAAQATPSSTHDVIVVFNDDRLISGGTSKYYILKATAGNVDTGASSNDSISMYLHDSDTSTTSYKYLDATCDNTDDTNGSPSKYCLADSAAQNDFSAWIIWSDSTGTDGNNTHTDINTNSSSSADWFNGYKLQTLDVQRTLN
jgi:hypothetical protein